MNGPYQSRKYYEGPRCGRIKLSKYQSNKMDHALQKEDGNTSYTAPHTKK